MTPEGRVKEPIKEYLNAKGAYFFMSVPSGYGKRTIDFLVCLNGRFAGIETKAKGKKPSAQQEQTMSEIRAAGGHVCWGDDPRIIIQWLEDLRAGCFDAARPRD